MTLHDYMAGYGLMVRVVGLGYEDPEFKSSSAVELIPGGVDSACHPSEVSKMSASLLVHFFLFPLFCRILLWQSGDPSTIVSNSQGDY